MENNKKSVLIVLVVILSLLVVGLSGYIIYDKVLSNEDEETDFHDIPLNKTFVIEDRDSINGKVYNGKLNNVDDNGKVVTHSFSFNSKYLKVDDKTIVELEEGAYYLWQVTFYDDIIITSQSFSSGHWFAIYDYDGNVIKKIDLFRDNNNRLFKAYLRYSDNEIFNVSNSGVISFVGTKHVQGGAGDYLTDDGKWINILYGNDDISNIDGNSIVKGIFKFSYLGNYTFSDIEYVKTLETFDEFKKISGVSTSSEN